MRNYTDFQADKVRFNFEENVTHVIYQPGDGTNYEIVFTHLNDDASRSLGGRVLISVIWPVRQTYAMSGGTEASYVMSKFGCNEYTAKVLSDLINFVFDQEVLPSGSH